jgi:hypothetical protein
MKIKTGDLIVLTDDKYKEYLQMAEVVKVNENTFIARFASGYKIEFDKNKNIYKKILIN